MKVCVVVPAYNAAATIAQLLESLLPFDLPILVVDDGSADETSARAEAFADRGVSLIRHPENRGKGAALRSGLFMAIEQGFDAAVSMDSDLQHAPADLPGLLAVFEQEKLDLLIGSRLHDQTDMPGARRFGNWISSRISGFYCQQRIFDSQCGFRIYRLATCAPMLRELKRNRFDFESEVLLRGSYHLLRIGFAPITVIYPQDALHKSFYRPWLDTLRILAIGGKEIFRRTFTPTGRRELRKLKNYVKSCRDWPRYYQLPGPGKGPGLG